VLYEAMIHWADLVLELAGVPLRVQRIATRGGPPPEWLGVRAQGPSAGAAVATIELEPQLAALRETLLLEVTEADGRRARWLRQASREEVQILDRGGWRLRSPEAGQDLQRLLRAWAKHCVARAVRGDLRSRGVEERAPEPWVQTVPARIVPAERGLAAMRFASEAVAELERAGVARLWPG
jgi:hypothetical protein